MTRPKIRLKTPAEFEQEGWLWEKFHGYWVPPESMGLGRYVINEDMFSPLTCTDALLAAAYEVFWGPDAPVSYSAVTPQGIWWTWRKCLFKLVDATLVGVCECGADKHGFTGHMRFCPKWS